MKESNNFIKNFVHFKESYIDRIFEFLFGYYKNPIKRFLKLFDVKRLRKMYRDAIINKKRIV